MDEIKGPIEILEALKILNKNINYMFNILKVQHEHILEVLEEPKKLKEEKQKDDENMVFIQGIGYLPINIEENKTTTSKNTEPK